MKKLFVYSFYLLSLLYLCALDVKAASNQENDFGSFKAIETNDEIFDEIGTILGNYKRPYDERRQEINNFAKAFMTAHYAGKMRCIPLYEVEKVSRKVCITNKSEFSVLISHKGTYPVGGPSLVTKPQIEDMGNVLHSNCSGEYTILANSLVFYRFKKSDIFSREELDLYGFRGEGMSEVLFPHDFNSAEIQNDMSVRIENTLD